MIPNEPVTLEALDAGAIPDGHGHIDPTSGDWTTFHTSYATVVTRGGSEFWKASRVSNSVSHVWRLPWDSTAAAATPRMRLRHGSDYHYIESVQDLDMHHQTVEIQTRRTV